MRKALFLAAIALNVAFAQGKDKFWTLDRVHSNIGFSIKHLVISEVAGSFKDFDVAFNSTKEDFSDARVEATIKVASINTDNDKRDAHLRTDDFFNADKYPQIGFKSTSFEKVEGNRYKIVGDLTIRDVTKRVEFDAVYNGSIKTPWGVTVQSWKTTATINRFDFDLKWNKALETGGLIAGDSVKIVMNFEFNR